MAKEPKRKGLKAAIRSWLLGPTSSAGSLVGIYSNGIDAGVAVNTETALRFTAVFAAIKLLSENIAGLPKAVMVRTDDGGYESADRHPAHALLYDRPNAYMDVFTFWFVILAWLLGKGNALARISYERGKPVALHPVNPDWVKVVFVDGDKMFVVKAKDPNFSFLDGTYLESEMLHFMLFTFDGLWGVDPIAYNAAAIGEGIAAQKFTADYFRTGGAIKGTIETDQALGDDDYERFVNHYQQTATNGATPVLEYGFKYKAINLSPEASQLIQAKVFSIDDIARIFCIPPHMLAELSHATFSNIEQQNIFFGEYSLRPICKRLEKQLELKLFTDKERGRYHVKFDLNGLMRGDATARANFYTQGINAGWMTPNEAREFEGMKRLEGLDEPRIPLNYTTVGNDNKPEEQ
jgi:HK97 family phage portal protein